MRLERIKQNRMYSKGFQVVYNGIFYEVFEHIQGISIKLVTHDGVLILIAEKDMNDIYIYDQSKESLKWLYRVEQLGDLKKYRVAESKDSGRTWDFKPRTKDVMMDPFDNSHLITEDLKMAKELKKKFEKQEEVSYASRLNKWQPIK